MKNIDKIREMTPKELAELLEKHSCDVCAFQLYEDCDGMDCGEGIIAWLEKEAVPTVEDVYKEFEKFCMCDTQGCCHCKYFNIRTCKLQWIIDNFNITNGKIERRNQDV